MATFKEQAPTPVEDRPVAKIKAFKRRGKVGNVDIAPSPQLAQLHGEIAGSKLQNIEINAKLLSLEGEKSAWEEEKDRMLKVIEQLNERRGAEPQSPATQLTQDIVDISLKEIEIKEHKERNQLL